MPGTTATRTCYASGSTAPPANRLASVTEPSFHAVPIADLHGQPLDLARFRDTVLLVVTVASRCGLTPQYAGLEELHKTFADRGFSVLGVPCNQFAGQEPGTAGEIAEFCAVNYGVTFPMTEKI